MVRSDHKLKTAVILTKVWQVGCYLSHVKALEQMKPGDVFAVFEEDAHFSESGPAKLKLLHDYVAKNALDFDLIFIGINRIPAPSGETTNLPVAYLNFLCHYWFGPT